MIDFITPENLRVAKAFAEETGMLLIAGNHEIHTCPNNVFSDEDFTTDLHNRQKNLSQTNNFFTNNIDFFCEEINGVKLVGINNYDYQISKENFSRLMAIAEEGLPIILFMHIPLYEEALYEITHNALLSIPDFIMKDKRNFIRFEQEADETTRNAVEFIKECANIKCAVCGHLHFNYESLEGVGLKQYVTALNTLREITVI